MQKQIVRRKPAISEPELSGFHSVLQRVYTSRGVSNKAQVTYQLSALLKPDLKGLQEAVAILVEAIQNQQKILIVGDFDADGATSTALAVRCLRGFGHQQVDFLVPNRFEYGYGLSPEIVEAALPLQPDIIITVDNGISSIEGVAFAKKNGIRVVVTDHHLPGHHLPNADAIVNPNQPGCEFISKAAAGVGVIFYVMSALRGELRQRDWFTKQRPEPNLATQLDLLALGTVADVVPLDHNNRLLVAQGLQRIRAGHVCPGIKALLTVAGRSPHRVQAADMGFAVGPRLNAAGRLDDMSIGIRCLLADTDREAMAIAQELDSLNRERRAIESSMQVEALRELDNMQGELEGELPMGMCIYRGDWHQGVIGILASRIKDKFHRPVIVFAESNDDELKGSGRSVKGIHLRDVLDELATTNDGLLNKFGGHAMAAGLTLKKQDLNRFKMAFNKVVSAHAGTHGLEPIIETDGELTASDLSMELAELIEHGGPWGQDFPEPCFDGEFVLRSQKIVGEKHLKMILSPMNNPQIEIDAIAFNVDTATWPNSECEQVRVVYKLSINEFRGNKTLQLMVDYFEKL